MKQKLLSLLFFIPLLALSQIPSYYNDVNLNLTGSALKDELATKVISTHTTFLSYTPGVWDALKQTDLDPNDNTKVLLIYGYDDNDGDPKTDRTRGVDMNGGAVGDWNREHTYPKSLGVPDLGTSGPGADAHHLRASDLQMNSTRNNRKFADGSGNAGIVGVDWYPGDEWKGDIARMMMYMYLRYGSQCLPTNVGTGNPVASDSNMIDLFLQWNVEDPVSFFEEQRNPILEGIQGNRNPFIDNPAFATQIWGGPQAEDKFGNSTPDTEAPTAPTNLVYSNVTSNTVMLSWTAATDNVYVSGYDVYQNGTFVSSTSTTSYQATGLTPETAYTFTVYAKDSAGNISPASNTVSVTTSTGSGSTASELFLSEYVEGSSYNKAIEIANFTGSNVDLSAYTLKRNTNGGTSWGAAYALSGTLSNGNVYVVAHSSSSAEILNVADSTTGADAINFNGNDPVGLFKNDVLIDIIGVFGDATNFAQDVTLRRIASVTSPTTTYNASEWDVFATDTFDGLGSHSTSGSGGGDTEAPTAPSNVVASSITETTVDLSWSASTDNVAVVGYDVYVDGTYFTTTTATNSQVTGLTINTTYTFDVYAKDAANNVSTAGTTSATTIDVTAPSAPANAVASNVTETIVDLSWDASTDNIGVIDYDVYESGVFVATTAGTSYQATGLTAGTTYSFVVYANDAAGNVSSASNTVSVTTNSGSGSTASELFLSEYVEGSSYNKAIEIANFTGSNVDLSAYSLKRNTNGGTSWGAAYALSGTLSNGNVYVVAHSSSSAEILNVADSTTGADAINFNGNDPVGLFKNDVLIDIIGVFGDATNFAQDVTLRRIASVTSPTTTYNASEWDVFATDTFDGLGSHSTSGSGGGDTEAPTAPANVVASSITETTVDLSWDASTDNVGVDYYDVYESGVYWATVTTASYQATGLTAGTTYSFEVYANDTAGNSSNASSPLVVTTDAGQTGPVVLHEGYFESGWDGWSDGGGDCAYYSGSRSYEGNSSIQLRDNSGTRSAMTSPSFDLTSFNTVEFEFNFYAYSMENGEDFFVRYYDGNSWVDIANYASGSDFSNNNFYYVSLVLNAASYNFDANSQFRIQCDASNNSDYIYVDQVIITGSNTSNLLARSTGQDKNTVAFLEYRDTSFEKEDLSELSIYPNPVSGNTLNVSIDSDFVNYTISNLMGQVVAKGDLSMGQIDVSKLQSGLYVLQFNDGESIVSKKFIKR